MMMLQVNVIFFFPCTLYIACAHFYIVTANTVVWIFIIKKTVSNEVVEQCGFSNGRAKPSTSRFELNCCDCSFYFAIDDSTKSHIKMTKLTVRQFSTRVHYYKLISIFHIQYAILVRALKFTVVEIYRLS